MRCAGVINPVVLSIPDRTGLRFGLGGYCPFDCCLKVVVVTGHSEASRFVSKNQKPVAVQFLVRARHPVGVKVVARRNQAQAASEPSLCNDPKPNGPVANVAIGGSPPSRSFAGGVFRHGRLFGVAGILVRAENRRAKEKVRLVHPVLCVNIL